MAVSPSRVGDSGTPGVSGGNAAEDHRHDREGFGGGILPAQGAGSTGTAITVPHSDHAHATGLWTLADYTAAAWTDDPSNFNGQTTASPVAGTVYLAKLIVPVAAAGVTSIWLQVVTAGVGLTSGQCFSGLYSGAGALLQTSVDQATAWGSTGLKQMTITSQALSAGFCYVAWFANWGTSGPRFHAGSNGIAAINFGLAAANSRFATDSNTGRTTTMPAALGTLTASNNAIWAGLS